MSVLRPGVRLVRRPLLLFRLLFLRLYSRLQFLRLLRLMSKIPPYEYIDFQSFVDKFMASFSVPDHYRPPIFQVLQSFVRKRLPREW